MSRNPKHPHMPRCCRLCLEFSVRHRTPDSDSDCQERRHTCEREAEPNKRIRVTGDQDREQHPSDEQPNGSR